MRIRLIVFALCTYGHFSLSRDQKLMPAVSYSKEKKHHKKTIKKQTTIIIYMAADNDLRSFAARNIKQMAAIGSNENIYIIVHLDIRIAGNKKITRRYYIEKNKILHVNAYDPETQHMDSGQPETLISACKWAITDYPAHDYALIFWNHGTGALDPSHGRIISPTELFTYNPTLNMLELDRSTSILGNVDLVQNNHETQDVLWLLEQQDPESLAWQEIDNDLQTDECDVSRTDPECEDNSKGICWDDSAGNYLTNEKLDYALSVIRKKYLNNEKFAIIGFDACLMSMIEVCDLLQQHAHIMVGSQEVELGTGWNYQKVLEPFLYRPLNKRDFARHIAHVYEETYNKITNDYTQSAIFLDDLSFLQENVNDVSTLLIEALQLQKNKSVHNAIRASKNKLLCTHFDEPSYIDLHHLYTNLEYNLKHFSFTDTKRGQKITNELRTLLDHGRAIIRKLVLANVCGKNLNQARGISIYFPERRIHSSYAHIPFAKQNKSSQLLHMYVAG
jgi:hypothetical protein